MGCVCSTKNTCLNSEDKVCELENRLEIKLMPAKKIHRLIYRYSYKLQVSRDKFELFCKDLEIERASLGYEFFRLFYNENEDCYDARELSSAAIAFGQGTDKEKIELLYKSYETGSSNSLDSKDIKLMIKHLTNIALLYSTTLAISNETSNFFPTTADLPLIEYQNQLILIKSMLASYYYSFILEVNQEKIAFEDFQINLLKNDVISLINPHGIRELSKGFITMLSQATAMAEKTLDKPERANTLKTFTVRLNERKNSRFASIQ